MLWAAVLLTAACTSVPEPNNGQAAKINTRRADASAEKIGQAAEEKTQPAAAAAAQPQSPMPPANVPCDTLPLPPSKEPNISCRQNADGFCAYFENGKMFYCQTAGGTRTYQSNKWASSLTFTRRDEKGRPLMLYYYAYGQLARTEEYDYASGVITRVWPGEGYMRLTRTALDGRVLDKYYFTAGKPYVRYPNGNDMGEINGEWHLDGDLLFTDGQLLYTLSRMAQPQWETGEELLK